MSSLGARAALVAGSIAALGAGWVGGRQYFDETGSRAGTVGADVDLYDCPMSGTLSIGQVHAGDQVQLIGVTGDRWAVIRHPENPDRPAWMPLAQVDTAADAGDLPELGCADAVDLAGGAPTASTAAPDASGSSTTILGNTTTSSSSTTSSTSTSTTVITDHTGPTLTVTADHKVLIAGPAAAACGTLTVTAVIDDPTLPLNIVSAQATWNGIGGAQEQPLTRIKKKGYVYTLSIPAAIGPKSGDVPLTITVVARDGLNNRTTTTLPITLRKSGACA